MTVYKCLNWTFSPDSQELIYADGNREQLPTRLSNCLLTLISSSGKTVSYDELLLKVWGTKHKDSSTISSVISEVRKLVGCGKQGKKIIVTVPKRGYRFAEPVEVLTDEGLSDSIQPIDIASTPDVDNALLPPTHASETSLEKTVSAQPAISLETDNKSKWFWLCIAVFLFVITWVFSAYFTANVDEENLAFSSSYEVVSHDTGREDEFDVSQDGKWLIYVNKAPNVKPSLIVKELISGKVQKLVATDDSYFGSPVFSSDAKKIAFHKQTNQTCEVWIADFSEQMLDDKHTQKLTNCGKGGFWSTLAFSKDGNQLYFSRANALTDPYKVYKLDLRTRFERSITSPTSSGRGDYGFALSPNGEQLAVTRNVLWQQSHIILTDTANNQSEVIFELPFLIARVTWFDDNTLIYCDKDEAVWSYNIHHKQHKKQTNIDFTCGYPVVSSGQLFAIKKDKIKNAIWTLNKSESQDFIAMPSISSPYYDFNAMFGPNESVYFISNRSGEEKLWQQTAQGFKQHENVKLPEYARQLEFSAETNSFYGVSQKRLFRYDLTTNEVEWLSKQQHEVFDFSISDSGRLLFSEGNKEYWSLKSLDLFTLKITDLNMNAFAARESNGQIYFTKFHEKGLWKKDINLGSTQQLIHDIDIKFTTFWDIWDSEKLIWASDNRFKIYDLKTGLLLNDEITYEGYVGYVKCNHQRAMCLYSLRENDETEIIKFKSK